MLLATTLSLIDFGSDEQTHQLKAMCSQGVLRTHNDIITVKFRVYIFKRWSQ